jgi:cyclic pyranopterin phosphate synthase
MSEFTHFDQNGNAIMVDVSEKTVTEREAIAVGSIRVNKEIMNAIKEGTGSKGDILNVARIAGIMATKKTSELIPMCHLLMITKSQIDFELSKHHVKVICKVKTTGKTGVEMEALTGVQIALLTIYDMCKAIDKAMVIENVHLESKYGGKSGDFKWKES